MMTYKVSGYLGLLCFAFIFIGNTCLAYRNGQQNNNNVHGDNHMGDNCGCQQGQCVLLGHGDFRCDCYTNDWVGDRCEILAWTLSSTQQPHSQHGHHHSLDNSCNYHGTLTSSGCVCHDNWTGTTCQFPPIISYVDHCNNDCVHGSCVSHTNHHGHIDYYYCKCDQGWHGDHCTMQNGGFPHLDHCYNHCVHGNCVGQTDQQGFIAYYHCQCDSGWYGDHCKFQQGAVQQATHYVSSTSSSVKPPQTETTTTTTTTPKPATTMTTLPPASATTYFGSIVSSVNTFSGPVALPKCDHTAVLTAIAQQTPVVNQNATECSPGNHASHDALVLAHCSVPQNPSSWQHGVNVMLSCGGSASLPTYTPVAAFDNGVYSSKGSQSGIFLGCTNTGFKIALQSCGQPPHITEIVLGGTNTQNPNTYYTIF